MPNYHFNPDPIARGGEKSVHRGVCVETGMQVVIKFLLQPYSYDDFARFSQEIARLQAAQGTGVARLIDHNLSWTPPFYVEEYFPEGNLAQHMTTQFKTGVAFEPELALWYVEQILQSLHRLHSQNIIHRDVKPPNILIRNGQLVFTDMGLGRTLNRPTTLQTRAFVGTRHYASPEQELGIGGVDGRSDLYAVGVILHELLTGQTGAYNRQTYQGEPAIRTIISRLLMFNREHRYAFASQVLGLVRQVRQAYTVSRLARR